MDYRPTEAWHSCRILVYFSRETISMASSSVIEPLRRTEMESRFKMSRVGFVCIGVFNFYKKGIKVNGAVRATTGDKKEI